jgi:Leucine-rich repeat (LRR) protein
LNEIGANAFRELLSLETLILSGNRIVTIDSNAFDNLNNLKVLKLNENKLQRIDPLCINPLKSIAIIQLFDNDLDLHYLSFYDKSAGVTTKEDSKLIEKGFLSDINQFIQQFDESGKKKITKLIEIK